MEINLNLVPRGLIMGEYEAVFKLVIRLSHPGNYEPELREQSPYYMGPAVTTRFSAVSLHTAAPPHDVPTNLGILWSREEGQGCAEKGILACPLWRSTCMLQLQEALLIEVCERTHMHLHLECWHGAHQRQDKSFKPTHTASVTQTHTQSQASFSGRECGKRDQWRSKRSDFWTLAIVLSFEGPSICPCCCYLLQSIHT